MTIQVSSTSIFQNGAQFSQYIKWEMLLMILENLGISPLYKYMLNAKVSVVFKKYHNKRY